MDSKKHPINAYYKLGNYVFITPKNMWRKWSYFTISLQTGWLGSHLGTVPTMLFGEFSPRISFSGPMATIWTRLDDGATNGGGSPPPDGGWVFWVGFLGD